MRTKLKIALLAFLVLTYAVQAADVLEEANSNSELTEWAKKHAFAVRVFDYKAHGKEVLVLLADSGSGTSRDRIYLYLLEKGQWKLVLVRYTNTMVSIDKTDTSLIFKAKSGAILLEQPFDSIQLAFSAAEQ